MGTQTMKGGWVGFERILKGLRQRQNRMKSEKLTWQQTFPCEPAQIKSYCKNPGNERTRNDKMEDEEEEKDDGRGLTTRRATSARQ